MSDINMTPLIDVMLVLLVIFIITAPLMASSLKLDLPRADGAGRRRAGLCGAGHRRRRPRLPGRRSPAEPARELVMRVREAARATRSTEVQLRADRRVPYGRVAELIGWCRTPA
jgi:biopolymer transport protein TolR